MDGPRQRIGSVGRARRGPARARPPEPPAEAPTTGPRVNEDWAATAVGIVLVLLVLAGVIKKGMIP
jgi:hypothetical protein